MSKLVLDNVTKTFGGVKAVNGVSLEFAGETVSALIGPNGAGKTTVFDLISGLVQPTEGQVSHDGQKISGLAPWRIARRGIGRLFQDVRVFERLTVGENVLASFGGQRGESALLSVIARRSVRREERALRDRAAELLKLVGLAEKADERAGSLSYGQQKLLALARLMAAEAGVLLLDEPTTGISPPAIDKLLELIRVMVGRGTTIVITEHNMSVVTEFVDWVFFMEKGRVVSSGAPGAVLGSAEVKMAYLGV